MDKKLHLSGKEAAWLHARPRAGLLRKLREAYDVRVVARGTLVHLAGREDAVAAAAEAVREMLEGVDVESESRRAAPGRRAAEEGRVAFGLRGGVDPRTDGQREYRDAIAAHDLVFCVGPAGPGR